MTSVLEGRVWKVGDEVQHDFGIVSLRAMREQITDPAELSTMLFAETYPEITAGARAGDIIVAGRRFAHGNPHNEAWVALHHRGMGVVCTSVPRGSYRNAIACATPLLVGDTPLNDIARTGQGIRVDFASGVVELDGGERFTYSPLPPRLLEIVEGGGAQQWVRRRLAGGATA